MKVEPLAQRLTDRLILRCLCPGDAMATSRLMTSDVSRWLASWPVPFTSAMASGRIDDLRRLAFNRDALPFAITSRCDGQLFGWATVTRNNADRSSASMSFWLGEAHQGKGYMREVALIVVAAGFELLGVNEIEAGAQEANVGSFAVMKLCGMTPAGERQVYASARCREELCRFYKIARRQLDSEASIIVRKGE